MRLARVLMPVVLLSAVLMLAAACASADPQEQTNAGGDAAATTTVPKTTAASTAPSTETTAPETTSPATKAPATKKTTPPKTTVAPRTTAPSTTAPKTTPPVEPEEPALAADVRSLCPATAVACVNIDAKVAWLQHAGEVTYGPVPITTGMPGYETPPGTFWVLRKHVEHVSSIYGTPMPYSVFFTDYGIAFHQGSLQEQSHGCVHLSWEAAEAFYNALDYGAEIVVA